MTTRIEISLGGTIALANYNNVKVSITVGTDVPEDTTDEVVNSLNDELYLRAEEALIQNINRLIGRLHKEELI